MHTLFISDLHLSPNQPEITASFIQFMREEAPKADALYVLGDLFDFWIGDDDPTPFAQQIKAEFYQLSQKGVACYFTKGNRDFLIGKRFAKEKKYKGENKGRKWRNGEERRRKKKKQRKKKTKR